MHSFQSDISAFIADIVDNYELTSWGLYIKESQLGFVLHPLHKQQPEVDETAVKESKLIHLWEDHWLAKQHIVKARIRSLFNLTERVFARKTKVVKLHKPTLMQFLKENHLNEPANGKFKYGLMLENELVAVAAFSASCPVHRGDEVYKSHQLIRFCNKSGITVVGGLSKLIAHFIKEQNPEDIMTYADLDWSDGGGYAKIGFEKIGELPPQKFSVDAETLARNYKDSNATANWYNQGSAKYLLDLKKRGE